MRVIAPSRFSIVTRGARGPGVGKPEASAACSEAEPRGALPCARGQQTTGVLSAGLPGEHWDDDGRWAESSIRDGQVLSAGVSLAGVVLVLCVRLHGNAQPTRRVLHAQRAEGPGDAPAETSVACQTSLEILSDP